MHGYHHPPLPLYTNRRRRRRMKKQLAVVVVLLLLLFFFPTLYQVISLSILPLVFIVM